MSQQIPPEVVLLSQSQSEDTPQKVLIVEDNHSTRRALVLLLRSRGMEPIEAMDLKEGLSKLSMCPDWVLLDLMLPDGNGVKILKKIREDKLPIKIAVTTGCHSSQLEEVHNLFPELVLIKPCNFINLFEAITIKKTN